MVNKDELLDASVKKKYALKYLIVQQKMSPLNRILIQFSLLASLIILPVIFGNLFVSGIKIYLFILLPIFVVVLLAVFNRSLNKKMRGRETIGFIQFFPHYMLIEQNNQRTELNYEHIFRVYYSNGMLDDYFSKTPRFITRRYKFVCKEGSIFLFECECFIRANSYDRKNKYLPDVEYVIRRIVPPGGIHHSKKEIRKEWKHKKA